MEVAKLATQQSGKWNSGSELEMSWVYSRNSQKASVAGRLRVRQNDRGRVPRRKQRTDLQDLEN